MMDSDSPNPYQSPDALNRPLGDEKRSKSHTEKLIVLATFVNSAQAHLLRNELADQGIDAKVANETTTSIFGATLAGPASSFWIEVLVLESDANRALDIKNRWLMSQRDDDAVDIPEWTCSCGEIVDAGFSVCWNCEANYDETPR